MWGRSVKEEAARDRVAFSRAAHIGSNEPPRLSLRARCNMYDRSTILNLQNAENHVSEFAPGCQILSGNRSHPVLDLPLQILDRAKCRSDMKCADLHPEKPARGPRDLALRMSIPRCARQVSQRGYTPHGSPENLDFSSFPYWAPYQPLDSSVIASNVFGLGLQALVTESDDRHQ